MEEPAGDLDFLSLECDEVGEEVFRQLEEEEEAAEKIKKGDFTITSSSGAPKAAEEAQEPIDAPGCPSGTESPETPPPPTPRRRERIKYTSGQTEVLEAFYSEDCFPPEDKKQLIADVVGVTVKNISIWFQNRRNKRKRDDAAQRRAESTPRSIPPRRKGASPPATKVPPARRSLLFRLRSPGNSREKAAHTSPLILAVLTGESSLGHCEALYLPLDTSQQSSTCNLQISYRAVQPGSAQPGSAQPGSAQPGSALPGSAQPGSALPGPAGLSPHPADSGLTSCLIFGRGGKPTGVVTISAVSVQTHSRNVQPSNQHGGSHHGNPDEDQQPPSATGLPQPEVFLLQESSQEDVLDPLSSTTLLPPVSAAQLSCLSVEATPPEELLEPQVGAASPRRPPASHRFEIDYEKYDKIHSHFHCDVSPTHFSF